jgi:hypothetical protein
MRWRDRSFLLSALFGLMLLLAGARRTSRRGREARGGLRQSRRRFPCR